MPDVRLMLGDCLVRMAELEPGSIDLILADLPYGTTACKWDTVIPFAPLWAHYRRLLKPRGAVVLTASQPFTSALVMSNPEWFRQEIIWRKSRPAGVANANRYHLKYHENVVIFARCQPTYNPQKSRVGRVVEKRRTVKGRPTSGFLTDHTRQFDNQGWAFPASVIEFANPNYQSLHPTQKPVALMEYLIRTYTNPGELVLDNTMGSGTTLVACLNTGRRGIGIEKDAEIFQTAEKRIAAAQAELAELLIA